MPLHPTSEHSPVDLLCRSRPQSRLVSLVSPTPNLAIRLDLAGRQPSVISMYSVPGPNSDSASCLKYCFMVVAPDRTTLPTMGCSRQAGRHKIHLQGAQQGVCFQLRSPSVYIRSSADRSLNGGSMKKPYVISINSVSGGGKTALARSVQESLPASVLFCFDDFGETNAFDNDPFDWWQR